MHKRLPVSRLSFAQQYSACVDTSPFCFYRVDWQLSHCVRVCKIKWQKRTAQEPSMEMPQQS